MRSTSCVSIKFRLACIGRKWLRSCIPMLVEAARAEGMHVGFYYSHAFDWEDPNAPGNDWDYP